MKKFILLGLVILFHLFSFSQEEILPDHLTGKIKYPVFNQHPYMGVADIDFSVLKYDPSIDYKIMIDVYDKSKDSTRMNPAISQVGRIYNLNIANGVPQDKLKMAVVIHWKAVYAILNDAAYRKKYGVSNPNLAFLKALRAQNIDLYVCGQNLGFFNISEEDIAKEVNIAISAKTTFIYLDQKGYTRINVNAD